MIADVNPNVNPYEWIYIDIATIMFYQFLQDIKLELGSDTYHVIFSHGTVAKVVQCPDNYDWEYSREYMESWPIERLQETEYTLEDIYAYNLDTISEQINIQNPRENRIMKQAFEALLGSMITKNVICSCADVNTDLHTDLNTDTEIKFYHVRMSQDISIHDHSNSRELFNLVPAYTRLHTHDQKNTIDNPQNIHVPDLIEVGCDAIDSRQLDMMFPKIYAMITPDMEIILSTQGGGD